MTYALWKMHILLNLIMTLRTCKLSTWIVSNEVKEYLLKIKNSYLLKFCSSIKSDFEKENLLKFLLNSPYCYFFSGKKCKYLHIKLCVCGKYYWKTIANKVFRRHKTTYPSKMITQFFVLCFPSLTVSIAVD